MSVGLYIKGIIPADEKYKKMLTIMQACNDLGIDPPKEVDKFFDGSRNPDPDGYEEYLNLLKLPEFVICNDYHSFDLIVDKIPSKYKTIRCYLS